MSPPSDTIKTRLLEPNLLVEDVHRRRSVHFQVEVIGQHRDLLDELVDEHTLLDFVAAFHVLSMSSVASMCATSSKCRATSSARATSTLAFSTSR